MLNDIFLVLTCKIPFGCTLTVMEKRGVPLLEGVPLIENLRYVKYYDLQLKSTVYTSCYSNNKQNAKGA